MQHIDSEDPGTKFLVWYGTPKTLCVQEITSNTVVDVLLLLVIHTLPAFKKPVEKIFRCKVADNRFTAQLLHSVVKGRSDILSVYFASLLCLTEQLVRSGGPVQIKCGSMLYAALFQEFQDSASQLEVGSAFSYVNVTYL